MLWGKGIGLLISFLSIVLELNLQELGSYSFQGVEKVAYLLGTRCLSITYWQSLSLTVEIV